MGLPLGSTYMSGCCEVRKNTTIKSLQSDLEHIQRAAFELVSKLITPRNEIPLPPSGPPAMVSQQLLKLRLTMTLTLNFLFFAL